MGEEQEVLGTGTQLLMCTGVPQLPHTGLRTDSDLWTPPTCVWTSSFYRSLDRSSSALKAVSMDEIETLDTASDPENTVSGGGMGWMQGRVWELDDLNGPHCPTSRSPC